MIRPEFSRPVRLTSEPREVVLEASESERAALAERFGILGLESLSARIALAPEPGGNIRARGTLRAAPVQACVVTLEPVHQRLEAPIDLRILEEGAEPSDDDPDSPDDIESAGGLVDLGEAVAEQLALALDPRPRAEGATLPAEAVDEAEPEPERPNPFAALARLKRG
jgi:uncharacterized metal-binding protein YceD (DUF177 family)